MRLIPVVPIVALLSAWALAGDPPAEQQWPKPGTPQFARALKGIVVGTDGNPVARALVACRHVRTQGEGLIQAVGSVQTDADGRFVLYPQVPGAQENGFDGPIPPGGAIGGDRLKEHGDRIPANSTFSIDVTGPAADWFPYHGDLSNAEPVRIRLQQPRKPRTFQYESPTGGMLDRHARDAITIYYSPDPKTTWYALPSGYRDGGKVAPGIYTSMWANITYQPVTITDDSPAEILFRLPPPVTYTGRVIDGVSTKPVEGAFVIGMTGTGDQSLTSLTDDQWKQMEALPRSPKPDDPALDAMKRIYTFAMIARTDAEGRYELLQKPEMGQTYGVVIFGRDRLPLMHRLYDTKPDEKHRAALPDLPLFPAGYASLTINTPDRSNPSIMPRWEFDGLKQPDWFPRLKENLGNPHRQFEFDRWLHAGQAERIMVPAGATVHLSLDAPYHEQWWPRDPGPPFTVAAGEVKALGAVGVDPGLVAKVRVLGPTGQSVEGAPIRRIDRRGVWCVVHTTDAKGEASFYVAPNSAGAFGIIDLPGFQNQANLPDNLKLPYQVGETIDAEKRFTFRLTPEQMQAIKGTKPGGAVG